MQPAVDTSALGGKLKEILLEKIEAGKLTLPAMPTTTAKVLEYLEDNNSDNTVITRLLETDPVLSLEVLRVVNSSAMATRVRIESLAQAISLLGHSRLRDALIAASVRQLFKSRVPEVRQICDSLWVHSVAVGAVARKIAVHAGFEDREAPYMAGLMHDVGKPVVGIMLLELERGMTRAKQSSWIDPRSWLEIVESVHRPVGYAIAEKWNLAAPICEAINDCVEYDASNRLSPSNAVRMANALAKREGVAAGNVDDAQVNTILTIGRSILGLDEDALDSLAKSVHEAAEGFSES